MQNEIFPNKHEHPAELVEPSFTEPDPPILVMGSVLDDCRVPGVHKHVGEILVLSKLRDEPLIHEVIFDTINDKSLLVTEHLDCGGGYDNGGIPILPAQDFSPSVASGIRRGLDLGPHVLLDGGVHAFHCLVEVFIVLPESPFYKE